MKQTSIKSDRVAEMLEKIVRRTGESKVDAVATALHERLRKLEAEERAKDVLAWLQNEVWANLPPDALGRAPSKAEQEKILGY